MKGLQQSVRKETDEKKAHILHIALRGFDTEFGLRSDTIPGASGVGFTGTEVKSSYIDNSICDSENMFLFSSLWG